MKTIPSRNLLHGIHRTNSQNTYGAEMVEVVAQDLEPGMLLLQLLVGMRIHLLVEDTLQVVGKLDQSILLGEGRLHLREEEGREHHLEEDTPGHMVRGMIELLPADMHHP